MYVSVLQVLLFVCTAYHFSGKSLIHICLTCKVGLCSKCLVVSVAQHAHHDLKELDEAFDSILIGTNKKESEARSSICNMRKDAQDKMAQASIKHYNSFANKSISF